MNELLGSFSIDIHHNFDHHTHSTDITDCELNPVKAPVNPFLRIEEQEITPGNTTYTAHIEIDVPDDVDTGDYHFMVKLTDAEGWQALKGISFKIEDHLYGRSSILLYKTEVIFLFPDRFFPFWFFPGGF